MPDNLYGVLIGGGIGIVGSFFSVYCKEFFQIRREQRSLAHSILGEINALGRIVDLRKYPLFIEQMILKFEENGELNFPVIHVRRDYFCVYKNNVSKIGILKGTLPADIATFYTYSNSILEDLESLRDRQLPPENIINSLKQLLFLFNETNRLANEIRAQVTTHYTEDLF